MKRLLEGVLVALILLGLLVGTGLVFIALLSWDFARPFP